MALQSQNWRYEYIKRQMQYNKISNEMSGVFTDNKQNHCYEPA